MSQDMGIYQFENEANTSYYSRLIYSGIGEWIKTACYDNAVDDSLYQEQVGATKHSVTKKCQKILDAYLELFPEQKTWFYPEMDTKNILPPVQEIRNRLIGAGCLVPNQENTLQYSMKKCAEITDNLYLYRGWIDRKPEQIIGLGTYTSFPSDIELWNFSEMFSIPQYSADEYTKRYKKYVNMHMCESTNPPTTREYFNYRHWGTNSNAWIQELPENLEMTLYRDNFSDYGCVFLEDDKMYIAGFPKWIMDCHEYRRFYYGLRAMYGKIPKVRINVDEDMFTLRLPSHLPDIEQYALYMLCWPKEHIQDKRLFIGPIETLTSVEKLLQNLTLNVVISHD
ncbi:hypothetical protein [Methanorbis rubei]